MNKQRTTKCASNVWQNKVHRLEPASFTSCVITYVGNKIIYPECFHPSVKLTQTSL